jgi:Ca2+-binding RTX toxin-like protein
MASFDFETITAAQALSITSTDTVTLSTALPPAATALYDTADPNVTIIAGANTVIFGPAIEALSMAGGLRGADGSTLYIGDAGDNAATLGATNDAMFGGAGRDTLNAGDGNNLLQGNAGADFLTGGAGNDTIYGGQDGDFIMTGGGINFAQGNKGDDRITGGLGADTLLGGQGNDIINGGGGGDVLDGNLGNDQIFGTGTLLGEAGNDTISGFGGSLTVDGANAGAPGGFDSISGGDGDDQLFSVAGFVDAGSGNDSVSIDGVSGNNTVLGGDGDDMIDAHFGSAQFHMNLSGDAGDDSIVGSQGSDTISGGSGNDTIDGGGAPFGGGDVLTGGAGQDLFVITTFVSDAVSGTPLGVPTITDWEVGDKIHAHLDGIGPATSANYAETSASDYASAFAAASTLAMSHGLHYVSVQVGPDVIVFAFELGLDNAAILAGRALADIDASNFVG